MNPILETTGLIAAIIICLFILVFVIIAVVFNLGMAFGMSWVEEKINAIKLLRPTVESVNKTTEASIHGVAPDEHQSKIIRAAASVPTGMNNLDKKVEQGADKVAQAMIEFSSRAVQVKTVAKAFFLPGLMNKKEVEPVEDAELEFRSPGYRALVRDRPDAIPLESSASKTYYTPSARPTEQVQNASTR